MQTMYKINLKTFSITISNLLPTHDCEIGSSTFKKISFEYFVKLEKVKFILRKMDSEWILMMVGMTLE